MPKKKTEDNPISHAEKGITQRAAVALLKGTGSFVMGASVAAVEVGVGERAGKGLNAVLGVVGLASEILLDPDEHPIATEAGKASLHSSTGIAGYTTTKPRLEKLKEARKLKEHDRMVSRLKSELVGDMEPDDDDTTKATHVPVKKAALKTAKKPKTEG